MKIDKSGELEIIWKNGNTTTLTFKNKNYVEEILKEFNSFFCRSILVGEKGNKRYLIVKANVNSISYIPKESKGKEKKHESNVVK